MKQLNTLLGSIPNIIVYNVKPHHYGIGLHATATFNNGHTISITTNTCEMDNNDTFEILATAVINPSNENELGQLYNQTLKELEAHLVVISKMNIKEDN